VNGYITLFATKAADIYYLSLNFEIALCQKPLAGIAAEL
jgi:hypothetical protein